MGEENVTGKSGIVGEWAIKDKDGNILNQGTDIPTQKEGGGEEERND